jgi:hypothetical protein
MHGKRISREGILEFFWLQCGEITIRKDERICQVLPTSNLQNVERTYFELKKNGVEFSEELTDTDWGKYAILRILTATRSKFRDYKLSMVVSLGG